MNGLWERLCIISYLLFKRIKILDFFFRIQRISWYSFLIPLKNNKSFLNYTYICTSMCLITRSSSQQEYDQTLNLICQIIFWTVTMTVTNFFQFLISFLSSILLLLFFSLQFNSFTVIVSSSLLDLVICDNLQDQVLQNSQEDILTLTALHRIFYVSIIFRIVVSDIQRHLINKYWRML